MRIYPFILTTVAALSGQGIARAEAPCPEGTVCVPKADMDVFLTLLRDQQCRAATPPTFTLDPITVVVDQEGRVYGTGDAPHPYTLKMTWCNYDITAQGKASLVAAAAIPPTWGFRFRPKFSAGFLFVEAFHNSSALDAIDVGVLWEGFYYKSFNLNLATGFRSAGVGIGVDLTKNFGGYVGYSIAYDGFRSNPYAALSFAFW